MPTKMSSNNIYPFEVETNVSASVPIKLFPKVIWIMGLSGSGKSTIAKEMKQILEAKGIVTALLDGDNLRFGLNSNLGFSDDDRIENIRRAAEVAKLIVSSGVCVICCFITPNKQAQEIVTELIPKEKLFSVYISTSMEECEKRDVKGLYAKARAGEIKGFTGIDSVFDIPSFNHLTLNNTNQTVQESVDFILNNIQIESKQS
jgi:adenylyl-sulfate kinase